MFRSKINTVLNLESPMDKVLVKGWIRTRRDSKSFSFIELNDGSCLENLQIIASDTLENYKEIKNLTTGTSISVTGKMLESPGKGQKWELHAANLNVIGLSPETYPLQKKRHTDDFLRTIAHLRPRTNKYGATFRIRSELSFAVHKFFREKNFYYVHTPIITASDCEGAGELFRVTAFDLDNVPKTDGKTDYSMDFFGKEAKLTVSGQLSGEMLALALGDIYTFGPTFRAENSNTRRHAAEFWMVEPEMAFCDLFENMDIAEELIKSLTAHILSHCCSDIKLFEKFVDKKLLSRLEKTLSESFVRITYEDAVNIIKNSGKTFEHELRFGKPLQAEHERFLAENHFDGPVIVYHYPKNISPFYMRLNDDHLTVANMDILLPTVGEIIGGSQREERLDILISRMEDLGLNQQDYWWYIDSRKFGTVPHSGFGLGFERMMMFLTGISNIRDVTVFPRTPKNIEF
ncbi:MAG: asparagine--tRNA ligase [Desulfobacterales bacterium]